MAEIILTQEQTAQIDDADLLLVSNYQWCAQKSQNGHYYAVANIKTTTGKTKRLYMHRLLMNAPVGYVVAHKDGNTLNNRRDNLHISIHSQKKRAITVEGKTKVKSIYRGVKYVPKGKKHWSASITVQGNHRHLGVFDSEIEAAAARDEAAVEQWGEHATLNITGEAAS